MVAPVLLLIQQDITHILLAAVRQCIFDIVFSLLS
jgi:hypothetical protein